MGIESGPSGAISVAGPTAPVISGIVNEGPVRGSLEGFRPMNIKPLGEIVFNQSPLTAEGAISEAEAIISEARVASPINKLDTAVTTLKNSVEPLAEASVVEEAQRWLGISNVVPDVIPANAGIQLIEKLDVRSEKIDNEIRSLKLDQASNVQFQYPVSKFQHPISPVATGQPEAVYSPLPQEQLVEQIVKNEEIKAVDEVDNASETREQEEIEELTIKYVEDEAISERRKYEIREAIKKASSEAEKEGIEGVEGWRIKNFLQPEHEGIRSGIAKPGISDGSLVETYQDISARDYESEVQAERVADLVVADKKPVKKAREGKRVKEADIARIRRDPFLKRHPVEEVVARVVKKSKIETKLGQKVEVTSTVVTEEPAEPTIKDLGLTDVFPKAV